MNGFNWWTKRCCGRIELSNQSNHNLTTSFLFVVDIVASVAILINLWTLSSPSVNSTRVWHAKNSVWVPSQKYQQYLQSYRHQLPSWLLLARVGTIVRWRLMCWGMIIFGGHARSYPPHLLSFSRWFIIEGKFLADWTIFSSFLPILQFEYKTSSICIFGYKLL